MIDEHWPTAIYYADLTADNEAIVAAMYARRREQNYAGGFTSYYDAVRLHDEEPFRSLMSEIMRHALEYMPPAAGSLIARKSWFSVMGHGGYHPAHAHPGSYISGAYYPRSVGTIAFHDPRPGAIAASFTRDPIIVYTAVAGRVILFPSWLLHEVPVNLSNEDRLSFSFNIENVREGGGEG